MDLDTFYGNHHPNKENPWLQRGVDVQFVQASVNRYKYVKPEMTQTTESSEQKIPQHSKQKILINPNFGKKVFVNPNFNPQAVLPQKSTTSSVIHVNTKIYNPKFLQTNIKNESAEIQKPLNKAQKIHVNPNVIAKSEYLNDVLQKRLLESTSNSTNNCLEPEPVSVISSCSILTSSSPILVNSHYKNDIKSKYKLVKNKPNNAVKKRRNSVKSLYKIVKSSVNRTHSLKTVVQKKLIKPISSTYKVDNRIKKSIDLKPLKKKFVYVNKFLSIGEVAKRTVIKKNPNLKMSVTNIKIGGVPYKKSAHSLKRTFLSESNVGKPSKMGVKDLSKSNKYKLVRKNSTTRLGNEKLGKSSVIKRIRRSSEMAFTVKKFKIIRKEKRSISPKKLKKCNIPCPFYRKYGICKANEHGKCFRKHDLDQIALCTKFLQGACVKENCRLSHKVSPEKMPTCKYYLEGSCSKDNCQYLHVKISPKAEICRDFIEGYCSKAAKCEKRHQYLCPDYEKYGKCPKQRCEYPHGKMVRHYYLQNKNKFVKKHSVNKGVEVKRKNINKDVLNDTTETTIASKTLETENKECKPRYYDEKDGPELISENTKHDNIKDFRSRPKLGDLPAFIPFS